MRLAGGPLIDRFGRAIALAASSTIALAGIMLFILAPTEQIAVIAAAPWGAGSALVVPVGIAVAANDALQGPARVAAVTSLASLASIAGPAEQHDAREHGSRAHRAAGPRWATSKVP
jgi:MFS family permease